MDIPIEWIYGFIGLLLGLIIASGGGRYRSISVCSPNPNMLVVVDDNGNTHISNDRGNSWTLTGRWRH